MKPNHDLRRERELHGWSQARLAEQVGTDAPTVSRWERGVSVPTPYFRERLCIVFDKDAASLGLVKGQNTVPLEGDYALNETANNSAGRESMSPANLNIFDTAIPMPPAIPRLVGRDDLLQHLKTLLQHPTRRHLTVLNGLPGVGKTALATMLAHDQQVQDLFPDGILWVGLGPEPDITSLLGRWGTLLNLPSGAKRRQEDWAKALHEAIGLRRMFLVIDDVWNVQDAFACKVGGPRCAHLITTRMPRVALHFALDGTLHVPELDEQGSLTLLASYVPELLSHDPRAARRLIQTVGGLPLALTLIGKYLRIHSGNGHPRRLMEAIEQVSEVQQRLHMSEPQSIIDAHSSLSTETPLSLHSIIEVSERYIEERGRQALCALAVFPAKPNSFSEEAALAVSQVSTQILDELSDVGLLECPEPGRYMLHCTIADYARMRLEGTEALQRFVVYMINYVEEHSTEYNMLAQEHRNILRALEEAFARAMQQELIRGVIALAPFLFARAMYPHAETYLRGAYTQAQTQSTNEALLKLSAYLAEACRGQDKYQEAEKYLLEGLERARGCANAVYVCNFLMNLSELVERRGDLELANLYLQEGQALAYRLHYRDRTFFHRMATESDNEHTCVFLSEPPAMIRRGLLTDIDAVFRAWPYAEAMAPEILQVVTGSDGHIYGLPREAYALCLLYNRRLFADAGLDPDAPPRTWDEFRTMAHAVSNPGKRVAGFLEATTHHQGGWRLTNWLYSAGLYPQPGQQAQWIAAFADEKIFQLLEMFREMRWSDKSVPQQALLGEPEVMELFGQGRAAMVIVQDTGLRQLCLQYPESFADFGLAPMPQNGGNACLCGGSAYVFQRSIATRTILGAFDLMNWRYTHHEATIQAEAKAGHPVGLPLTPLLIGPLRQQLLEINARYCNVPQQNYRPYLESPLHLVPEPPFEAQKCYELMDVVMQAAFTDPHVNLRALLEQLAQQLQHVLTSIEGAR